MTVYDIALRMSQNCNIFPEYVYLHAGTREGAINAGLISKNDKKEKLTLDEIVSKIGWLKGTKPYLIEDYLCIYKENINKETLNEYLSNTKTVKKHKINTKITKNMNCNNNQKKFK